MKSVKLFMFEGCPHCRLAQELMREIFAEHPEYAKVPLEVIDEHKSPEVADRYDYYLVPTFYVGEEKMSEGHPSKQAVERVFAAALE